jgi:DDE family transposase
LRSLNRGVKVFQRAGPPVMAVDAKQKALVGPFAHGGRDDQPHGQPARVRTHEVPDKHLGKIGPSGVYAPTHKRGWVSVGSAHATAQGAGASSRRWWWQMGQGAYPQAHAVLITADGGGSKASRQRLGKVDLQQLAAEIGIAISVRHFPPGTRKWQKLEHRMCCHMTENGRGRPLSSREVVVNFIGQTTTTTGLTIQAELDKNAYPTGMKVSTEDMKRLHLSPAQCHGKDWNYAIKPRQQRS